MLASKSVANFSPVIPVIILAFSIQPTAMPAQALSLYQAIQYALQYNQTILYNAEQNYHSGIAQWEVSKAAYRPSLYSGFNVYRSFNRTSFSSFLSGDVSFRETQAQQLLPYLNLQQTFLTPLGSRLGLNAYLQTTLDGLSGFAYQTRPRLSLSYLQPLSASGIASGHGDIVQAKYQFQQTEMGYQLQKEQLAMVVIQNYSQLWQAFRSVDQSERDFESARRILEIAELQLKFGRIAELEVLNIRVQFRLTEDNLLVARNQLRTQMVSFLRLLGMNTNSSVVLAPGIPGDSITFSQEQAIETAWQNRLELKQAQISLDIAEVSQQQALSFRWPALQLNASYYLNSFWESSFVQSLEFPDHGWNIQASLSFPLFEGGSISARADVARYQAKIQENNLALLKEDIAIDIENRYRSIQLNQRRIKSLALNLVAAREALDITEKKFQAGQITSTEIENVRNRYLAAQNSLNSAQIIYITERAGLAQAMGQLMEWVETLKKDE